MEDMEKKGYIRKLPREEIDKSSPRIWYLPHFGIINPNKPNKIRIVFDAASKANGVSLNDCLLTGPDLYNSLFEILLNFRLKKYAFTADIREMFLQILVRQEDRISQRILWRGRKRDVRPDIYEICVVFFGSTSGPCLAQEAKNRNAKEFENEFPEAANAITKDHYMDDYLGNADTIEQGVKLIAEVIETHRRGGFIICNWICNSEELLSTIPEELRAGQSIGEDCKSKSERILGAWWNPKKDLFCFETKFHKINQDILNDKKIPTKRDVLKVIMSIFDPLGFITNFLIQGKILLQEIWKNQIGWDEEIPEALCEQWILWLQDLKKIFAFEIPRQYFTLDRSNSIIQLHIITDASDKAYAAVAYLRVQCGDLIETSFVTAKARVAPLKPTSIPRLELQGALIGARLGSYLKSSLRLDISNIFYWTDSKIVLHWIRSEAGRFKVFVAHRLGEIQDLTNVSQWRYITSKLTYSADQATKRRSLDFSKDSTWLYGPCFLKKPRSDWPLESEKGDLEDLKNMEFKTTEIVLTVHESKTEEMIEYGRFSKWQRILRAVTWVLRFVNNCRRKINREELQVEEIKRAENYIFQNVQRESFPEECQSLKMKKQVNKSSKLYKLNPELGLDGLLRINGRINNLTSLDFDQKKPIILPSRHKITELLIQFFHEQCCHQGIETVLVKLREKFWILKGRQAVKTQIRRCQKCKNSKNLPEPPLMGQLPLCRLEPTVRCFIKTGIDYFGPLKVTVKRSIEKRYGVIFTCMVTRAIHLEIAHNLSTDAFIHVLRQFGCRRGFPEEIFSDNGTNFTSAERELKEALNSLKLTDIVKFCSLRNIKWKFNPPLAPHMGGAWERLIRSVKNILKEMLKNHPQEYVLRTLFAEAENIINSRPLTHISTDPNDSEPLTPNHFLIGPAYAALPCCKSDEGNINLLSKWRAAQKMADHFWKRWTREYMLFLINRHKWHNQDRKNLKVDDVVILVDANNPRNVWPKGMVSSVYPAKDGHVRMVEVKTANGMVFRRPATKLIKLDVRRDGGN